MENYIFMNTFKFDDKEAQGRIAFKLLMGVTVLVFVLKTFLDGFSIATAAVCVTAFGFFQKKGNPVIDVEALTEVRFDGSNIRLIYRDLDRHDGAGSHTEEIMLTPDSLKKVRYNEGYRLLEISHDEGRGIRKERLFLNDDKVREPLLAAVKRYGEEYMNR